MLFDFHFNVGLILLVAMLMQLNFSVCFHADALEFSCLFCYPNALVFADATLSQPLITIVGRGGLAPHL